MMIQAIRLTRKKAALAVILAGAVLAALILLLGQHGGNVGASEQPCLSSNGERVAYLRELGWEIDPEPLTTLQFLLPPKLSGDYITYNDLQKSQGFDLETCCGKQVTRYTYTVTNYPQRPDGVQLNLYICEDLPVAGDVVCTGTDGFQDTLGFPTANGCLLIADCSTGPPPTSDRTASRLLPLSSPISSKPPKCLIHFVFQHSLIPLKIQNPEAVGNTKLNWA